MYKGLLLGFLLATCLWGQIRVNVGGPQYTDQAGNIWAADNGCTSDSTYTYLGAISGTQDPTLYQTGRTSASTLSCTYTVPINAYYIVTLKFAEYDPKYASNGNGNQRLMNIKINNVQYYTAFDVYRSCGFASACDISPNPIPAATTSNGTISIVITQQQGQPMLSALEIDTLNLPLGFITLSGIPSTGQVPTATSSTTANWQTPVFVAQCQSAGDSASCINSALSTHKSVYLPPATYTTTNSTISIPANTCLIGGGTGTLLSSAGAAPSITILNSLSSCVLNLSIQNSVGDGVLEEATDITHPTEYALLSNVNILGYGTGHNGVHLYANGNCCVYFSAFDNVNITNNNTPSGGSAYKFEASNPAVNWIIRPSITNGRVADAKYGINTSSSEHLKLTGTEFDDITDGAGGGIAIWQQGPSTDSELAPRFETGGGTDKYWQFDNNSCYNQMHVAAGFSATPSQVTDNGCHNVLDGGNGSGGVTNYTDQPQIVGNITMPSGFSLTAKGQATNTLTVGGALTSGQATTPGIESCQSNSTTPGPCMTIRGGSDDNALWMQSHDYSESTTAGNQCRYTAYGIPLCTNGAETNSTILMLSGFNFITNETGTNNNIAGTLGVNGPPISTKLQVTVLLAHTLQAGGPNTFNYAGNGAVPIRSASDATKEIQTGWAVGGSITLFYCPSPLCINGTNVWLDISNGYTKAITALTGDVTATGPGSVAATLASVGSAGSCGDATHSCSLTFDAKGRETAQSNIAITGYSPLVGTSTSIGGSSLTAGTCATATISMSGATTGQSVVATPATYPGDAYYWRGYVSSANTVTVSVCAAVTGTPTTSVYEVRVLP